MSKSRTEAHRRLSVTCLAACSLFAAAVGASCAPQGEGEGGAAAGPAPGPRVNIKNDGNSTYGYPVGPPQADTTPSQVNYPLGPTGPTPIQIPPGMGGGRGLSYVNGFEVSFPGGTAACPNHVHQRIKDTVLYGIGTPNQQADRTPPPQPPNDPGGYNSPNWAPDPPPDGINPGTQSNADGTKSYLDTPGLIITARNQLPARKRTKFRWELHDCNHQLLDCKTAELDLQIDRRGRMTRNVLTPPRPC